MPRKNKRKREVVSQITVRLLNPYTLRRRERDNISMGRLACAAEPIYHGGEGRLTPSGN